MFLLATVCLFGFASAQKVTRLSYCSIDEHHLRMDCKFEPSAESPDAVCKYMQGGKILDTTDLEEQQHPSMKTRAKVLILKGNNCRLRFNNLPNGRSNFTCSVKQMKTASKTSVVEKKLLLPCCAVGVLLQNCSGLLLVTLMALHTLLGIHWL